MNTILRLELGAMTKGSRARWNETLWHKTKGDMDYKTHEGDGKHVQTIRD